MKSAGIDRSSSAFPSNAHRPSGMRAFLAFENDIRRERTTGSSRRRGTELISADRQPSTAIEPGAFQRQAWAGVIASLAALKL
jgi:hypothetical protein